MEEACQYGWIIGEGGGKSHALGSVTQRGGWTSHALLVRVAYRRDLLTVVVVTNDSFSLENRNKAHQLTYGGKNVS